MTRQETIGQHLQIWLRRGVLWTLVWQIGIRGWRKLRPGGRPGWFEWPALSGLRHLIWRPEALVSRLGLLPGMKVVEVGAGTGGLTLVLARAIGADGYLLAIDERSSVIEHILIETLEHGLTHVLTHQATPANLPAETVDCDLIVFTAVFGGLSDKQAVAEAAYRALRPAGAIAISEFVVDPDYCLASTVVTHLVLAGFGIEREIGNFSGYTIIGRKAPPPAERRPT